jgi:hypothetical protein
MAAKFCILSLVNLPHSTLADFADDAVVQERTFWVNRAHDALRGMNADNICASGSNSNWTWPWFEARRRLISQVIKQIIN